MSTSLRELQGWRIVRVVHVLGDRRDHFESIKDVWEIFRIVSEERKRREIDPTLNVLAECFPERQIVGINCVELVWGLGTLHCMTQQQPARWVS